MFVVDNSGVFFRFGQIWSNYWPWKHQTSPATLAKIPVQSGTYSSSALFWRLEMKLVPSGPTVFAFRVEEERSVLYPVECVSVALGFLSPVWICQTEWARVEPGLYQASAQGGRRRGKKAFAGGQTDSCQEMFSMHVSCGTGLTWTVVSF